MSDALPLPPRPNLEQYKKLAKDLQSACRSGEPEAIRQWAARAKIASKAKAIEQRWQKFNKTKETAAPCKLTDVQFFIAREHGFASWPKFASHVAALARANTPVSNFEAAADAIAGGDLASLKKLLAGDPKLTRARSTREHRSTLLHYVSANGVEDFRQKTPENIAEIAKLLLDAGADINAESDAYGGGCTALGLVATSIHPEQAGVQIALLETLLDRGARTDQPYAGNGHSLIGACLANGQPKSAEFFAERGVPLDLEAAAALGRLTAVRSLLPLANQRQMESAFLYACGYGQKDVAEFLLERGIDAGLRGAGGRTGLHWAANGAHLDVMKLLLERGSPIGAKDEAFDATPLDVALWVWDNSTERGRRERCYEAIALMSRAGATLDPQQWQDADMLEKVRSDARMLAALRGESATG